MAEPVIDANTARATAGREIKGGPQQDDPQFEAWRDATPGVPLLVHDLLGQPSYWLVPIQNQHITIGAIRVLLSGRAAASIAYRAGSNLLALDATEILEQAKSTIGKHPDERVGEILLVHDGPPGREAWRVEVMFDDQVVRWIFVTPGGIYERIKSNLEDDQSQRTVQEE